MGFIIDDRNFNLDQEAALPLIGLFSAFKELKNLEYEKVLILPCDSPLIKYDFIDLLIEKSKNFDCCIPKWQDGLLEPLIAIYATKKAYESSLRNLKLNQYKLTDIIRKDWKINYISIEKDIQKLDPNLLSLKNINTQEDIKILEDVLNKTK